jgi:hypothetical protein
MLTIVFKLHWQYLAPQIEQVSLYWYWAEVMNVQTKYVNDCREPIKS